MNLICMEKQIRLTEICNLLTSTGEILHTLPLSRVPRVNYSYMLHIQCIAAYFKCNPPWYFGSEDSHVPEGKTVRPFQADCRHSSAK